MRDSNPVPLFSTNLLDFIIGVRREGKRNYRISMRFTIARAASSTMKRQLFIKHTSYGRSNKHDQGKRFYVDFIGGRTLQSTLDVPFANNIPIAGIFSDMLRISKTNFPIRMFPSRLSKIVSQKRQHIAFFENIPVGSARAVGTKI